MKLIPYKKLIAKTKELKDEALAPIRSRQMKKKAELEMMKIEESIITQEAKVQELASEHPIDFDKMLDSMDELALMERRKGQFKAVIEELFPEEKEAGA